MRKTALTMSASVALLCAVACSTAGAMRVPAPAASILPMLHAHSKSFTAIRNTQARSCIEMLAPGPETAEVAKVAFEPEFHPETLAVVMLAVLAPFGYWWFITVPEQRLALSKDKRRGEVREYIATLKEEQNARPLEKWFFQKWLKQAKTPSLTSQTDDVATAVQSAAAAPNATVATQSRPEGTEILQSRATDAQDSPSSADQLRALFAPASKRGNPTPKFFSGDNPIVVTTGTMMMFGIVAALARQSSWLAVDFVVLSLGLAFGASRLTLK